jgi:hypothetical protein
MNVLAKVRSLVETRLRRLIEHDASLYCCRPLLNAEELQAWMRQNGFPSPSPDMHVTICYSTTPISWEAIPPKTDILRVTGGNQSIQQFDGGATVLSFESAVLHDRWQQFRAAGASFDYHQYVPHITLTYDELSPSLLRCEPYRGVLIFGPEVYQEIEP